LSGDDVYDPLMYARWPGLPQVEAPGNATDRAAKSIPVPDLFEGIDPVTLSPVARRRVARLQARIDSRYRILAASSYRESAVQTAPEIGYHRKTVVDVSRAGRVEGRIVHKPMSAVEAAKCEFVTILCNLLGMYTPLSVRHELRIEGRSPATSAGVSTRFLEEAQVVPDYDFRRASPEVLRYAFLTRWLNELVGNLHCWWAQFLVPLDPAQMYSVMVMIDLDEAFNSVSPGFLQHALTGHFGKLNVRIEDCRWMDREFSLDDRFMWDPEHYDSQFNIYGYLLRDFVLGRIEIDFSVCSRTVRSIAEIPDGVFQNAMRVFVETSRAVHKNEWVLLPAAHNPKHTGETFRNRFVERIRRSSVQYIDFLDALADGRNNQDADIYRFYAAMPERPY
jgi:hypothetical protein